MWNVFRQKPDISRCALWATMAFFIIPILCYLCPSASYAQILRSQSSVTKPLVNIKGVIPEKVHPGDSIEIFFDADISGYERYLSVTFDKVPGDILLVGIDVLKVRVPKDLPPGDRVWVVVSTPDFKTPPARIDVVQTVQAAVDRRQAPQPIDGIFTKLLENSLYIGIIVSLTAVILAFLVWWRMRERKLQKEMEDRQSAVESQTEEVSSLGASVEAEPNLPPPPVPDELIAACQKRECIVFAGADLSKSAGLPTWQEFVEGLFYWAMDNKILDPEIGSSYRSALQKGQADLVADGVARAVQDSKDPVGELFLKYLQEVFIKPSAQPTPAHRLLKQIGVTGALTTNLDSLLEQSLESAIFTPQDAQQLQPKLAAHETFVLKLFGTLDRPDTVQISPAQYRDTVADNKVFLEFVEKVFLSRTVLFVGTSLDGVQFNMEALGLRNVRRPHYALVGVSGSEWRARAESLRRLNVQILPYSAGEEDTALLNFLGGLATKVEGERGTAKAAPPEPPRLKHLKLTNIGPFKDLDLELDPNWNILLGNNGVGKSSILKAIALALCGKSSQPFADRLLKYGKMSGEIVMGLTDDTRNHANLYRTNNGTEIKATAERELLGTERWLAMGFPPLRQLDWIDPKGPMPKPGTLYTTPADLLPLITGEPDPRMKDLKQSIINMYTRSLADEGGRYKKRLTDFYDVLGLVAKGVTLREWQIDTDTWKISVKTDDDEVPLAAVSQGMQSLIGWIGLMLQRQYEVYDNMENPREGPGLVLIDEIDAHMHPFWQQNIVLTLSELFPNVQFIATTHSPLVVSNTKKGQLIVFVRDSQTGSIVPHCPDVDPSGMGAAGLLTSNFFGLYSQLDKVTQDQLDKKRQLAAKEPHDMSEEDKETLRGLDTELSRKGFNYSYRDPLYAKFLEEWARETKEHPELGVPPLTPAERERQTEYVRNVVAKLKQRKEG
jgi:hypothetical protein